jgi:hypothetical protein
MHRNVPLYRMALNRCNAQGGREWTRSESGLGRRVDAARGTSGVARFGNGGIVRVGYYDWHMDLFSSKVRHS